MKTVATVALMMINAFLLVLLVLLLISCSWFKSEAKHIAGNIVDCTTSKAKAAIKQYAPIVEHVVVMSLDAAGKAQWDIIKDTTSGLDAPDVSAAERAIGGCVIQSVINRLLDPFLDPDAPASSPLEVDKADLARGWDELRAQRYRGALFKGAQ